MLSVLPCSLGFVAAPNAVVHAAPHRPQRTAAPTAQAAPPAAGWKPKDTEKMPGVSGPVLRPHSNPDPDPSPSPNPNPIPIPSPNPNPSPHPHQFGFFDPLGFCSGDVSQVRA